MSSRTLPWLIAGGAGVLLVAVLALGRRGASGSGGGHHPDPRPGVLAIGVLAPAVVPHVPGAADAYAVARRSPAVLDGLYCHCHCRENAGHRSLLTCFESEHGAYCDICMNEAMLAADLTAQGNSLAQIRQAIDARFGS